MQALALIRQVEDLIRMEIPLPLNQGGQICGIIQGGAIGFHQDAGRHFLLVSIFGDRENECAIAFHRQALGLHLLQHGGNIRLRIALTQPGLKMDVQIVIVLSNVCQRNRHDVLPQGAVARPSLLEGKGGLVGPLGKGRVLLTPGGSCRIDGLQLRHGKGRFLGIGTGEAAVKIAQLRLPVLKSCDDEAHLQPPVAQMHVPDGVIAEKLVNPLHALADDGRTQVANVQRLGHIGAAVIHHNGLWHRLLFHPEVRVMPHGRQIGLQERAGHPQIDKTGHRSSHRLKVLVMQLLCHSLGNLNGRLVIRFGGGKSAVTLVFAQVRAV